MSQETCLIAVLGKRMGYVVDVAKETGLGVSSGGVGVGTIVFIRAVFLV